MRVTDKHIKNILWLLVGSLLLIACRPEITSIKAVDVYPDIYPDYIGVTVPATIAPLNFNIKSDHKYSSVKIIGSKSGKIALQTRGDLIDIPEAQWEKLLEKNKGGYLSVLVSVVDDDNREIIYRPFSVYISTAPIDYGIAYRLIAPGYTVYSKMGIYERALNSYKSKAIFENTQTPRSCVNCHSFNQGNPSYLSLHIRGEHGGTLLKNGKTLKMLDTKRDGMISSGVYPYWHPSGKYIAYSVNLTEQLFHPVSDKRIEVYDKASDIYVYSVETDRFITSPLLQTESFETYPAFSPDGRTLYFCCAEKKEMPRAYKELKYSLCSISFNPENGSFGNKTDTLFSSVSSNKSVSFPRPSFDGKYLMFILSDYGCFSIWHKESDIWLLDLEKKTARELTEVNSNDSESFPGWSSNSRWFLFTSRQEDGLYTRVYICHMDDKGNVDKPFLLPQKNPSEYYDRSLYSYNIPEFISRPIDIKSDRIEEKILNYSSK